MNSKSLPLRAPASSIMSRPGYVMGGYPHSSYKEQEVFVSGGLGPQIQVHVPCENSNLNFDFGRGARTSAPSMSTPLNPYQTAAGGHVKQQDQFGFGAKSMTSSLNLPAAPQSLPYPSMSIPFQAEYANFNSINAHPGFLHPGPSPGVQGVVRSGFFQSPAHYQVQPQVIPPQFVMQQRTFQFQNQQSQFGTARERHMGFPANHVGFNHRVPATQFSAQTQIPVNPNNPRMFEHNVIRMNTYSAGVQPQVMHPYSFQSSGGPHMAHGSHDFSQKLAPDFRRTEQASVGDCPPARTLLAVTGGTTIKGYKPTVVTENQDKSLIIDLGQNASAYAVFDGHGPHGDVVAEFVSNKFSSSITQLLSSFVGSHSKGISPPTRQQIKNFFIVLFHNIDIQLSELRYGIPMWSGCTAAVCVRIFNEVHIAWVGDSRVVIYKFSKPTGVTSASCEPSVSWWTTSDHVPNRPDELSRITDCGASITVYSTPWLNKSTTRIREHGIAMSRSFGDKAGSQFGVICRPDMASIRLKSEDDSGASEDSWAIVVASDGIWDSLSEEEVGYRIMKELIWRDDAESPGDEGSFQSQRPTEEEVTGLAASLSREAWSFRASVEKYSDDTTLIISIM